MSVKERSPAALSIQFHGRVIFIHSRVPDSESCNETATYQEWDVVVLSWQDLDSLFQSDMTRLPQAIFVILFSTLRGIMNWKNQHELLFFNEPAKESLAIRVDSFNAKTIRLLMMPPSSSIPSSMQAVSLFGDLLVKHFYGVSHFSLWSLTTDFLFCSINTRQTLWTRCSLDASLDGNLDFQVSCRAALEWKSWVDFDIETSEGMMRVPERLYSLFCSRRLLSSWCHWSSLSYHLSLLCLLMPRLLCHWYSACNQGTLLSPVNQTAREESSLETVQSIFLLWLSQHPLHSEWNRWQNNLSHERKKGEDESRDIRREFCEQIIIMMFRVKEYWNSAETGDATPAAKEEFDERMKDSRESMNERVRDILWFRALVLLRTEGPSASLREHPLDSRVWKAKQSDDNDVREALAGKECQKKVSVCLPFVSKEEEGLSSPWCLITRASSNLISVVTEGRKGWYTKHDTKCNDLTLSSSSSSHHEIRSISILLSSSFVSPVTLDSWTIFSFSSCKAQFRRHRRTFLPFSPFHSLFNSRASQINWSARPWRRSRERILETKKTL